MNLQDISNVRLKTQRIDPRAGVAEAQDIVAWMGAIQAQDYAMACWAIGLRGQGLTERSIQNAIDQGEILRTHVLRPTWHFVAASDIWWMLELSAPQLVPQMKSRLKQFGIILEDYLRINQVMEKAFLKAPHLDRAALLFALKDAGICSDREYLSHFLLWAEVAGIICSGAHQNNKATYALLEERVPRPAPLKREEALAKLAHRYFTSHGPATLLDFKWWSGLSLTDSKKGLEMIKSDFVVEEIGSGVYWIPESFCQESFYPESSGAKRLTRDYDQPAVYLLPAFDEFLISYKDRTASFPLEHHAHAFTNNGIFYPVVLVNGQVKGVWKRTLKGSKFRFEARFFSSVNPEVLELTEIAAVNFGIFLDKEIEVIKIG
ncbi:winged helix DNA-binding domain-containing protein [Pedobacter gandavensis]|uniref:winged helix DNA-binding domain-containing protein n=1 Tax=Pedobacter gandavensis TaxID=2679963 RepID=UPI00292DB279|nr:winged helix DNA-binding domain-containing protein [Pedobacter gandavensis]